MDGSPTETAMVHYECYVCGMIATCVATEASTTAWADHMYRHPDPELFGCWMWSVVALPLEIERLR